MYKQVHVNTISSLYYSQMAVNQGIQDLSAILMVCGIDDQAKSALILSMANVSKPFRTFVSLRAIKISTEW